MNLFQHKKIFSVDGTNVILHSWTIIIVLIWAILGIANPAVFVSQLIVFTAVMTMVTLHEFGHVLAAKKMRLRTGDIYITPIGGMAMVQFEDGRTIPSMIAVLGGPLVNVILFPFLYSAANINSFFGWLNTVNIVLLVFNMLPAYPLDGGRVFKYVLMLSGVHRYKSTWIAARTGQVFGVLFILFGAVYSQVALVFIGIFVIIVAQKELKMTPNLYSSFKKRSIKGLNF